MLRISTFNTNFQYYTRDHSQCNKEEKERKIIQIVKEEVKFSSLANDMSLY